MVGKSGKTALARGLDLVSVMRDACGARVALRISLLQRFQDDMGVVFCKPNPRAANALRLAIKD